jgi:uncharacterized protein (DUF983 family)
MISAAHADLPFVIQAELSKRETPASAPIKRLRVGDVCPGCQRGRLDYDGLLNLVCPQCGYAAAGEAGGCT